MKSKKNYIDEFSQEVGEQENRKLEAMKEHKRSVWQGLGMFGMVGWTIAVPTLGGVALGKWLDKAHPRSYSWTLTLLFAGLVFGCSVAWYWIKKEHRDMHAKNENNDE